jgi:glycosyltransferase involved in cell wall biosynthesis
MQKRAVRVVSNLRRMGEIAAADAAAAAVAHEYVGEDAGALAFVRKCLGADLVILNIDQKRLMLAGLARLLWPAARFRLVSADLILRPPRAWKDRAKVLLKRALFSRVDRFVLYFKDLRGYERFYGIGPGRAAYVPFKVNGWDEIRARPAAAAAEGEYVLCAGRTLRDVATFVEAMRRANCPGVLLQQRRELLDAHGSASWEGELPPNVRLVIDDSDRIESYLDFIGRARLVVIPRFGGDIAPTGISTYLVAMALERCVVISAGPGAGDVLTAGEAVVVPPEDPAALAEQIRLLWDDEGLRATVPARGRAYAERAGDERRLLSDILRVGLDTLRSR